MPGVCNWRTIEDADRTVTCGKLLGGEVIGILKETGVDKEPDDKTQEAIDLLKREGYKIVKK